MSGACIGPLLPPHRLRGAGLLGSTGTIGDCFDNSVVESFFGTLQLEPLDEHHWQTRKPLALAIFRVGRGLGQPEAPPQLLHMLSPVDDEAAHAA